MAVCSLLWHPSIVRSASDLPRGRYRGADPDLLADCKEPAVRRSSVVRLLAASTSVLLVVGTLSGCFLLPFLPPAGPAGDVDETPTPEDVFSGTTKTGDCWDTNYDDLAAWASWEGSGPVDCDEAHQSYTYLAGNLEAQVDEPYDSEGMTSELALAISEQCRSTLDSEFGVTDKQGRISFFFFAPTESEWKAGSRAIRCDIAVLALGSDYLNGDIDLEDLPADIDDVDSDSVAYQLCLTGDGIGPYEGSEAIIADCTDEYFWRYGGNIEYPGTTETDPYPAGDTLFDYAIDKCPLQGIAQGETVYPYVPSEDTWVQFGDRIIECWFSTVGAPSSPV